jgi:hypothetical protein
MKSALIGYTGGVGATLAKTNEFDLLAHRSEASALQGIHLGRLVCSLPSNPRIVSQNPTKDAENLAALEAALSTLWVERFILLSTTEVYRSTTGLDESDDSTHCPSHPFGANRLVLEHFARDRFDRYHIVRLPIVFGHGERRNALADLGRQLTRQHPASRLQWYPLARLACDLHTIERHELPVTNLCPEPLITSTIIQRWFSEHATSEVPDPQVDYDLRTRHSALFGGDAGYIMSGQDVLSAFEEFVAGEEPAPHNGICATGAPQVLAHVRN